MSVGGSGRRRQARAERHGVASPSHSSLSGQTAGWPMAGGGHLGPLSYVYGYRGGIGRRRAGQDTTRDDDIVKAGEGETTW